MNDVDDGDDQMLIIVIGPIFTTKSAAKKSSSFSQHEILKLQHDLEEAQKVGVTKIMKTKIY